MERKCLRSLLIIYFLFFSYDSILLAQDSDCSTSQTLPLGLSKDTKAIAQLALEAPLYKSFNDLDSLECDSDNMKEVNDKDLIKDLWRDKDVMGLLFSCFKMDQALYDRYLNEFDPKDSAITEEHLYYWIEIIKSAMGNDRIENKNSDKANSILLDIFDLEGVQNFMLANAAQAFQYLTIPDSLKPKVKAILSKSIESPDSELKSYALQSLAAHVDLADTNHFKQASEILKGPLSSDQNFARSQARGLLESAMNKSLLDSQVVQGMKAMIASDSYSAEQRFDAIYVLKEAIGPQDMKEPLNQVIKSVFAGDNENQSNIYDDILRYPKLIDLFEGESLELWNKYHNKKSQNE